VKSSPFLLPTREFLFFWATSFGHYRLPPAASEYVLMATLPQILLFFRSPARTFFLPTIRTPLGTTTISPPSGSPAGFPPRAPPSPPSPLRHFPFQCRPRPLVLPPIPHPSLESFFSTLRYTYSRLGLFSGLSPEGVNHLTTLRLRKKPARDQCLLFLFFLPNPHNFKRHATPRKSKRGRFEGQNMPRSLVFLPGPLRPCFCVIPPVHFNCLRPPLFCFTTHDARGLMLLFFPLFPFHASPERRFFSPP